MRNRQRYCGLSWPFKRRAGGRRQFPEAPLFAHLSPFTSTDRVFRQLDQRLPNLRSRSSGQNSKSAAFWCLRYSLYHSGDAIPNCSHMPAELSKSPEQNLRPPLQSSATTPNDPIARQLRGFGPLGLIAILAILLTGNVAVGRAGGAPVFLPVGASLVLVWRWMSRTPWRELGYVRPKSWIRSLTIGILFGVVFKFLMKAIVMPILGAPPINQAFHFLAGNHAALPVALWSMIFVAGWGEETLFRGYMFERLGKLLGSKIEAKIVIVLVSSLWFGWDHYSGQGLAGVEQAIIVGLVYGTIFMITGRLFMLMCAHAAFDLAALAIIYWDLESRVAHLVFR